LQANLGNAASAAAAAAAAAAARQQVEEKAEEKARRAEKMKEIEAVLTPQATDSPMVQTSVNKGTDLLSHYTYDSQRVVVAKQNLLPLEQAVAQKQKLYSAEHQEEDKWRAKIESDVALERDAQRSKNAVSERLAQLKVMLNPTPDCAQNSNPSPSPSPNPNPIPIPNQADPGLLTLKPRFPNQVLGKRESQDEPQLRAEIEQARSVITQSTLKNVDSTGRSFPLKAPLTARARKLCELWHECSCSIDHCQWKYEDSRHSGRTLLRHAQPHRGT
jgi:hypothetical protein